MPRKSAVKESQLTKDEGKTTQSIRETDLFGPVADFLAERGYAVQGEVHHCDVVAIKGEELLVVELKQSLNLSLVTQAVTRQRIADAVYVAVPRPKRRGSRHRQTAVHDVLRRLELGLMYVSPRASVAKVEVVFDPAPYAPRRRPRERALVLKEVSNRSGSYNVGGSAKAPIMTAYRERALAIACALDEYGELSPKQLRSLGTGERTAAILQDNYYGWFQRVRRGVYALAEGGRTAILHFSEPARRLREALAAVRTLDETHVKHIESCDNTRPLDEEWGDRPQSHNATVRDE